MPEPDVIELVPTEMMKDGWVMQHDVYPDGWWVKRYWESIDGSHRDAIIQSLEGLGEFASVLEVGCNAGPNLRRIHSRWPQVDLMGMDIHPGAIKYGQLQAKEEGWRWVGYEGDLRDLFLLGKDFVDVSLSCYSLAYLDPRDIDKVLATALACAKRALILCEPMTFGGEEVFIPPGKGVVPEYHFDYEKRVTALYGRHTVPRMTRLEISPPHGRLTSVLTIHKGLAPKANVKREGQEDKQDSAPAE